MQSNSKNKKNKIAAIVLAVALCICTGSYVVYSYVNSSRFNPDISNANDVKINEIDLESETEKMNAEKPDKSNDATDLDKRRKKDGAGSKQNQNKKVFVTRQANKYLLNTSGKPANSSTDISTGDIIGGIVNGNGQNGTGNSQNGSNSGNTNGGSGSNNNSGNNSGNNSNNNPADNNGDRDVIFPTLPALVQPSKTIPKDIYEDGFFYDPRPNYEDDNQNNNSVNMTLKVTLADSSVISDNFDIEIYNGEALSDYTILCRVWAYAVIDGTEAYRFRQISNNFYIKDYPETAVDQTGNNEFYATFCFRQTSISEWQYQTIAIPIVGRKLLLGSYEEGVYPNMKMQNTNYLYPEKGQVLDLLSCYAYIQGGYGAELTQLFRGWSETVNGVPIEDMYTVNRDGLIYLYPSGYIALPEQFNARLTTTFVNGTSEYWQTIYAYNGDGKTVNIPKYIQSIKFDEMTQVDEMNLPYTTKNVDFTSSAPESQRTLVVKKQYTVDENNKYLSTVDGALASKDKTVIYDIPSETTEFTVPETVTEINLSQYNKNLKSLTITSFDVPTADISNLDGAKIYVPSENYLEFLNAWGSSLGTNELLTNDGSAPEYIYVNGAILSDYGKTLYSVDESAVGTLILPDYVEKVAANSIQNKNIDSIIFGKNFKEIEDDAINTDNIKRLFFLGGTVTIENNSITAPSDGEDDMQVFVQSGVKDTFTNEWSAVMGDRAGKIISADNMEIETKDGFTYLKTDGGAILFEAPKDITIFNIGSVQGVTFKEIGSNAFKGCKKLRFADLTASIKRIGKYAFRDCDSLEGVTSLSRDEITVDKWIFTQYNGFNNTLKYVVFNALYGYIDEEFQNINREVFFAPYNTYGYGDDFGGYNYILYYADYYAGGYRIDHLDDDERIVYAYQPGTGFIVCSATKGIEGTITFPDETVMIHDYAFANCKNKFEIKNYESITFISSMAFSESGLSGEYNFESLIWAFDGSFSYCENLTKVEMPNLETLQAMTFSGCANLEEVIFGEELAMINSGSFDNCTNLKSITLTTKTDEETGDIVLVDLYNTNWFSPFEFGTGVNADSGLRIHIIGSATPQDYIEAWKDQFTDFFNESNEDTAQIELEKLFGVYTEPNQTEQKQKNTDGETVEGQKADGDNKNNDEINSDNTNREEK